MIEEIRKNIESALKILDEINSYQLRAESVLPSEQRAVNGSIKSLQNSVKLINNSIPFLINGISITKALSPQKKELQLAQVAYEMPEGNIEVTLSLKDKDKFLEELSINEGLISKLKKTEKESEQDRLQEFKAAQGYLKVANRFFLGSASEMIRKGKFQPLVRELRKANLNILPETYLAMIIFSVAVSFVASFLLAVFFVFFELGFFWPFIQSFEGSLLMRVAYLAWIPLVVPLMVFFMLYFYPSAEKNSLAKHIEQELPFAVIHMSSISGSGIEPSKIFQIICMSREYPYLRREIRKVLNQINIYGYDIVTSLTNVAKSTPSDRLSEVLNGLATTIHSGGEMSEFFEQRAETLLTTYRLDREKFTKVAETFMDIYISVVIATPMILILLLIMISVSGIQIGFSPMQMSMIIIFVVALINIIFLGLLHVKQPNY